MNNDRTRVTDNRMIIQSEIRENIARCLISKISSERVLRARGEIEKTRSWCRKSTHDFEMNRSISRDVSSRAEPLLLGCVRRFIANNIKSVLALTFGQLI